ncbi:CD1375 family protein [Listeria seeligeri]|uniref:CD1375 family protein n=1 Tax=Listeria seeligeri TaxID=1640 RepID=UPI0022EAB0FD|nr:CD1375 family protein [Listeria seeligeri]
MAYMIPIYVNLVMNGRKEIEDVPANLRGQVKAKVDELRQEEQRILLEETEAE